MKVCVIAARPSLARFAEQLREQTLRLAQPLIREDDALRPANRVGDVARLVQTFQCIPVETLPRTGSFMKAEPQKGQGCLVYSRSVEFHGNPLWA